MKWWVTDDKKWCLFCLFLHFLEEIIPKFLDAICYTFFKLTAWLTNIFTVSFHVNLERLFHFHPPIVFTNSIIRCMCYLYSFIFPFHKKMLLKSCVDWQGRVPITKIFRLQIKQQSLTGVLSIFGFSLTPDADKLKTKNSHHKSTPSHLDT